MYGLLASIVVITSDISAFQTEGFSVVGAIELNVWNVPFTALVTVKLNGNIIVYAPPSAVKVRE